MAAAVCSRASRERPHRTVCEPSSARVRAMALPMPRPAPVTTATWPARGGFAAGLLQRGAPPERTEQDACLLARGGSVDTADGAKGLKQRGVFVDEPCRGRE